MELNNFLIITMKVEEISCFFIKNINAPAEIISSHSAYHGKCKK